MRMRFKVMIGLLGTGLLLGLPWALLSPDPGSASPDVTVGANVSALTSSFLAWSARHEAEGGDRGVVFALGWSKGFSREASQARGVVRLDLVGDAVGLELWGLSAGDPWDVWLVENRPGGSAMPDAGDRMHRLGRVVPGSGRSLLSSRLGAGFFNRFHVDLVVVARAGRRPDRAGVLFGSPDLFQRLYTQRHTKPSSLPSHMLASAASLFGPGVAFATPFDSLDPLVAEGAALFQNEHLRRQWQDLRHLPPGAQQLHDRPQVHRDPAAERSAFRFRDQPGPGAELRERDFAAPARAGAGEPGRVRRPARQVRAARGAPYARADELAYAAAGLAVRADPARRAARLGRRRRARQRLAARVRARSHHPALPAHARPHARASTSACRPTGSSTPWRRSNSPWAGRRIPTYRRCASGRPWSPAARRSI